MENSNNIKKVCGFYVSSVHLITMILPFIRKELDNKIKIETFFENNLKENVNRVLEKVIIKDEEREKILKINWKKNKLKKYLEIEKILKNNLEKNNEINLLISGNKKHINETNNIINKFLIRNEKKIINKNIKIINCYEVTEFEDNIKEILDEHEYILNTSGLHRIEEVFEDYKKISRSPLSKC